MIDTTEAVRLATEALLNTVCSCENREDEWAFLGCSACDATGAVSAALPALAEQFAALIEGMTLGQIGMHVNLFDAARDRAARLVREAAEVTE